MRNSLEAGNPVCETPRRMGRKLRYPEKMIAALPAGTFERMEAVAREDEDKTDLIREAVERELARREAKSGTDRED